MNKNKDLRQENKKLRQENKKLKSIVSIDFLTKVTTRQAFYTLFKAAQKDVLGEKKYPNRRKHFSQFSLLLIDVDDFKKINDTYGHLFGDKILKKVAEIIKNSIREFDVVARWGGEEFVILLRGTNIFQAKRKAEFIVAQAQKKLPITLSVGVVQSNPKYSPTQMFKQADLALYRAKHLGKNRVVINKIKI
ncbi:MAG TPA: GGDEF domain-containing protein [bacterium]|nr:GGDEF domain-containing protein [bacterium]HPL95583.1 GGDEF domain-containing protein [bacterium]